MTLYFGEISHVEIVPANVTEIAEPHQMFPTAVDCSELAEHIDQDGLRTTWPKSTFEVDGIVYDRRTASCEVHIRPMIELIDNRPSYWGRWNAGLWDEFDIWQCRFPDLEWNPDLRF